MRITAASPNQVAELEQMDRTTRIVLSTLCEQLSASTPELDFARLTKTVTSLLKVTTDTVIRTLCTQWIAQRTSSHGQSLDVDELSLMASLVKDPVRDIRVHSRVAFSTGLWNNVNKTSIMNAMVEHFANIFVTQPVLLASPGSFIAQDFTHKINGPILVMVDELIAVPPGLERLVQKYFKNSLSFKTISADCYLVLKKVLKRASKWERWDKTLNVLEKLFLRANKEENEDLAVQVLGQFVEFLAKGRHGQEYQASARLLEAICKRMIQQENSIYPQCLHLFSSLQELPQNVFLYYHLEISPFRIQHGGSRDASMEEFLQAHALNCVSNSDTSALTKHIESYCDQGLLISRRTVHELLKCLNNSGSDEGLWCCFLKMAELGYYFKQIELEQLFGNGRFSKKQLLPICVQACLKTIQNQSLPHTIAIRILEWAAEKVTMDSLNLTAALFEYEEDPKKLVERVVKVALKALSQAQGDPLRPTARNLLQQIVLKVTDLCHSIIEAVKEAVLGNVRISLAAQVGGSDGVKRRRESKLVQQGSLLAVVETDCGSDLELLLQLMICYPDQVTWKEINLLASKEGPSLLLTASSNEHLRKIHRLCFSIAAVLNQPELHIFFHIINVRFCEDPQESIQSLCHCVRESSEELCFHMRHLDAAQDILSSQSWAAEALLKAVEDTKRITHLDGVCNTIFVAWTRARSSQVQELCEKMLHGLTEKGWKLQSEGLQRQLTLLLRILGQRNLKIPADKILGSRASSAGSSASTDGGNGNEQIVEFQAEDIQKRIAQFLKHFKLDDLSDQVTFGFVLTKIYDGLEKIGRANFMKDLMEDCRCRSYELSFNESRFESFQRIQFFVENSPAGIMERDSAVGIARDAQVFSLGLALHKKLPEGDRNKCASFISASDLLTACKDNEAAASQFVQLLPAIQSYSQVYALIGKCSGRRPLWCEGYGRPRTYPQDLRQCEEESICRYFLGRVAYQKQGLDKHAELRCKLEQALRIILKNNILSLRHFEQMSYEEQSI